MSELFTVCSEKKPLTVGTATTRVVPIPANGNIAQGVQERACHSLAFDILDYFTRIFWAENCQDHKKRQPSPNEW
jgi:hypothetical protein